MQHRKQAILLAVAMSASWIAQADDGLLNLDLQDLLQVRVSVASQFTEDQMDASSTVSSIQPAQWQEQGARTLTDALQHMPGVIVLPNWFGAQQILIRGFADSNNTNGVAQVWDGVPMNFLEGRTQFTHPDIQLGVLDDVEVIRGPGSALYGDSAFHGVLALKSFSSDVDMQQMDGGMSSNGYANAGYKQSLQVAPGVRLNVAIAASGQPSQNQPYTYTDPASGISGTADRGLQYADQSAVFRLQSDTTQILSWYAGLYLDKHNVADAYSQGANSVVAANDVGGVDSLFTMEQAGMVYRLDSRNSVEWKLYAYGQQRQLARTQAPDLWLITNGGEREYGSMVILRHQATQDGTRWSLQLGGQNSRMGDYSRFSPYTNGTVDTALTGPLPFSAFARRNRNIALDAESPVPGLSNLVLHWGGRYDKYSDFGGHFSPHAGLVWHLEDNQSIKLLYGNAFRAPNAGEVLGISAVLGNAAIQPETIGTWELSYMKRSEHVMTELTVYHSQWNSIITIVPTTTTGYIGQYANSGTSTSHGIEFSQTWQFEPWSLSWNASYTQSKNDSNGINYQAFPPVMFNTMANYHWAARDMDLSLNEHVNLDTAAGEQGVTMPAPGLLRDYWRTDLHMSQPLFAHMVWSIDVRNVFNRRNFLPSIQPDPSPGGLPDLPRSVWLGLCYSLP